MNVFNIEKYGDFDMPYTAMIMIAPAGMSKKIAREVAKEASELCKDTNDEQIAVSYLESWGCVVTNSINVHVGGNL